MMFLLQMFQKVLDNKRIGVNLNAKFKSITCS